MISHAFPYCRKVYFMQSCVIMLSTYDVEMFDIMLEISVGTLHTYWMLHRWYCEILPFKVIYKSKITFLSVTVHRVALCK